MPLVFGVEIHGDGVEAVDVAGGAVNGRVESDGVGAAVGQSQKGVARGVGDGRAETAERVCRDAVFQGVGEAGDIGKRAGAGLVEGANGEERKRLRVRRKNGEQ